MATVSGQTPLRFTGWPRSPAAALPPVDVAVLPPAAVVAVLPPDSAVVAVLVGLRLHRVVNTTPWYLLAAGLAALVIGDSIFNANDLVFDTAPFPSVADVAYLGAYPFLCAGVVLLVRRRLPGQDAGSLVDALMLGVGFGVASWVFLMEPYASDHGLTLLGFLGLATPNFLLALILMFISFTYFGTSVGGLFSPDMQNAPWSMARVWDLIQHLWIPVIVIGTSGTAGMIRRLRANLLDELRRPYVVTARAKGLAPRRILLKYPLRLALNPFIGDIGNLLPEFISGSALVSVVLSLPTTGPVLVRALQTQDMYLAGSFLMLESFLVVVGVLVSDLLLAWLDPRIRFGGGQSR